MLDIVREASLIRKVVHRVYWNTRYKHLRAQIEEEDLLQMTFLKLLHRDNYKKYSDSYSLSAFLYLVAHGCAISYSRKKSVHSEMAILDGTLSDEDSATLLEVMKTETPNIDMDVQYRINRLSASMDSKVIPSIVIRYKDREIPFSLENLFDFFLETLMVKGEIHRFVINKDTNKPVSDMSFNRWWTRLLETANKELAKC